MPLSAQHHFGSDAAGHCCPRAWRRATTSPAATIRILTRRTSRPSDQRLGTRAFETATMKKEGIRPRRIICNSQWASFLKRVFSRSYPRLFLCSNACRACHNRRVHRALKVTPSPTALIGVHAALSPFLFCFPPLAWLESNHNRIRAIKSEHTPTELVEREARREHDLAQVRLSHPCLLACQCLPVPASASRSLCLPTRPRPSPSLCASLRLFFFLSFFLSFSLTVALPRPLDTTGTATGACRGPACLRSDAHTARALAVAGRPAACLQLRAPHQHRRPQQPPLERVKEMNEIK